MITKEEGDLAGMKYETRLFTAISALFTLPKLD
jgi:hypothetical protein